MPQIGVLWCLSTPTDPLWAAKILDFHILRRIPRRTTYKKISHRTRGQTRHFWEKTCFFLTFRDFFEYIAFQSILSQSFMRQKRRAPILIDRQGVAGNYRVLIFFSSYQVDELRNEKCGTHIKKLTAMKFRNWKKVSYHSNRLGKAYVEKNKNLVKVQKSNYRGTFFKFFYL